MNLPYSKNWGAKDPIEDTFVHATERQINYIELLKNDIGLSLSARNAHFNAICKRDTKGDVWRLTRVEASKVISQFKEWKEQLKG